MADEEQEPATFTFDYDSMLNEMTLGDFEDIEEAAGVTMAQFTGKDGMSMKTMRAMIWVSQRRSNPDLEFDDLRAMRIVDIADVTGEEAPTDPTQGAESE